MRNYSNARALVATQEQREQLERATLSSTRLLTNSGEQFVRYLFVIYKYRRHVGAASAL